MKILILLYQKQEMLSSKHFLIISFGIDIQNYNQIKD